MLSIDITEASWTQQSNDIVSEIFRLELEEEADKITVMAYLMASNSALGFAVNFYDASQTYISSQYASGGSYVTYPDGAHYVSVKLLAPGSSAITGSDLFSAILYQGEEYTLPLELDVSIETEYHISENNGYRRTISYDLITGSAITTEYSYELVRSGNLWTVIQTTNQN